nr:PREDICTED: uncharacterized protein LOC109042576 [Bemisia tabaci]
MFRSTLACLLLGFYYITFSQQVGHEARGVGFWDNKTCNGSNGDEGICMSNLQCGMVKGKRVGNCGLFGACCQVQRSCNQETDQKVTFFNSPSTFTESDCNLKIKLQNRRIGQIRVDFLKMILRQPSNKTSSFTCIDDTFTVTPSVGLPALCGVNDGQHIYINVNASKPGYNSAELKFHIAKRSNNSEQASWSLKITQLEVPPRNVQSPAFDADWDINSIFSDFSLNPTGGITTKRGQNKQRLRFILRVSDYDKVAPPGCLQYYTAKSGMYKSFNLNNNNGPHLANLNYAICFKKVDGVCAIKHTPVFFQLSGNSNNMRATDRDCDTQNANNPLTEDYLFVPDGITSENVKACKFCYNALGSNNSVTARSRGPQFVTFMSDDKIGDDETLKELGFSMNYEFIDDSC